MEAIQQRIAETSIHANDCSSLDETVGSPPGRWSHDAIREGLRVIGGMRTLCRLLFQC